MRDGRGWAAGVLAAVLAWCASAAEPATPTPPKPAWQRMLAGADAEEAGQLERVRGKALAAEKWDDAIKASEAARDFRKAKQGADHWEVADAEWAIRNIVWMRDSTADQRVKVRAAGRKNAEGIAALSTGRIADAHRLLDEALALRRAVLPAGHPQVATSLSNTTVPLRELGRSAEAEAAAREALALRRAVLPAGHPDTIRALNILGTILQEAGRPAEAEPLQREALALIRTARPPDHPDVGLALSGLAGALRDSGRTAEAEPFARAALEVWRAVSPQNATAPARAMDNLIATLRDMGRLAEAEALGREALRVRRATATDRLELARSLNNLAETLTQSGRPGEAEPLIREALALLRAASPEHPDVAGSLTNLADALHDTNRGAEAESLLREALAIRRAARPSNPAQVAASLNRLGVALWKAGRAAEAEPLLRESLALRRASGHGGGHGEFVSLNNLAGVLWSLGRASEAEQLLDESLSGWEAVRLSAGSSGASRADLAAVSASPAHGLAVVRLALNKPRPAWQAAESQFARGLLDDLALGELTRAERDESARLSSRLAALERSVVTLHTSPTPDDAIRSRLQSARAESRIITGRLGEIAARQSTRLIAPLERVQKALRADEAIAFWIDAGARFACVIRHSGTPVWVLLPGLRNAEQPPDGEPLPRRTRAALASPTADAAPLLARLRASRVEPLLPHLMGVSHLFAIPAGDLAGIPLEALDLPFRVSYTPSASVLAFTRERHRDLGRSLLAVGAPEYRAAGVPPAEPPTSGLYLAFVLPGENAAKAGLRTGDVLLEYDGAKLASLDSFQNRDAGQRVKARYWRDGTEAEAALEPGPLGVQFDKRPAAEAVASRRRLDGVLARRGDTFEPLHGARVEIDALCGLVPDARKVVGADASVSRLRQLAESGDLGKYRLLHFATHGTTDPHRAANCALVLSQIAGTPDADGRLTAGEIDTWKLDADLAVLSACQTGLGRDAKGEGLLGFTQVLMRRGVRSVVVSLWKVDDAATAILMRRFYQNLLERKQGRAAALAEAKAWLRNLTREEALAAAGELGGGVARGTVERLKRAAAEGTPGAKAGERVFAHPFYWSAFVLLGDPD